MFGTCKWEMVSNTDPFPDGNFNPSKYLPQCGFPAGQGRKVVCARVFLLETHRFSENSPSKMWGTNMENGYRKLKFLLVAKLKNKLLDALICPTTRMFLQLGLVRTHIVIPVMASLGLDVVPKETTQHILM